MRININQTANDLEQDFNEALLEKNEQTIEQQKQVLEDATVATRVEAEKTALNEEVLDNIEDLEDKTAKLKKQILRKQVIFGVLVLLCIIVAVARYVAWTV